MTFTIKHWHLIFIPILLFIFWVLFTGYDYGVFGPAGAGVGGKTTFQGEVRLVLAVITIFVLIPLLIIHGFVHWLMEYGHRDLCRIKIPTMRTPWYFGPGHPDWDEFQAWKEENKNSL